jgi:hypothetical protein
VKLAPTAREWYALEITTTPAVTAWECSFDDGDTWVASTTVGSDGYFRWLVAGPTATPGTATVLPLGRTQPVIRATENPEIIVRRKPPQIDVE